MKEPQRGEQLRSNWHNTGAIVAKQTSKHTRKKRGVAQTLRAYSLRVSPEHWEKLDWVAKEKGVERSDVLRMLVADAVRYAKPPESLVSREIPVSDAEWQTWEDCATEMGVDVRHLIAHLMRGTVKRTLGESRGQRVA